MNVLFTLPANQADLSLKVIKNQNFFWKLTQKTVLETIVEQFSEDDNFFFCF